MTRTVDRVRARLQNVAEDDVIDSVGSTPPRCIVARAAIAPSSNRREVLRLAVVFAHRRPGAGDDEMSGWHQATYYEIDVQHEEPNGTKHTKKDQWVRLFVVLVLS